MAIFPKIGILSNGTEGIQMLCYAGVVNTQKLVGTRHHVDVEVFPLGTFFVHKKEHRLVWGSILENDGHDLKQSFAQSCRAAFGDASGLRIKIA